MALTKRWQQLHLGKLTRVEIATAVDDDEWQRFRVSLKGKTTSEKYLCLIWWLSTHKTRRAEIQVTNYVNALKRGGQL